MSTQLQAALYIPPRPSYLAEQPSLRQFLRTMRTNALLLWPEAAYEQPFMVNRRLGRTRNPHQRARSNPPGSRREHRQLCANGGLLTDFAAGRRRRAGPERRPRLEACSRLFRCLRFCTGRT